MTGQTRSEQHCRRLLADVAIPNHRVARRYAGAREERRKLLGRLEVERFAQNTGVRDVPRPRDMPGLVRPATTVPRLRPIVECRRASVDDRDGRLAEVGAYDVCSRDDRSQMECRQLPDE